MPTDEVTGLPPAIHPIDLSFSVDDPDVNYHHHFYNRRDPDLEGDLKLTGEILMNPEDLSLTKLAGLAVRMSRGQRLPTALHRLGHDEYPLGPALPHTIDEKFVTTVKACTGIISRWAIDLTSPDADNLIYMDDDTFARVASPQLLCTERVYFDRPADYRRRVLGNFFLRYAIRQDLSHISEKTIEQFLAPRNEVERQAAGNFILVEAMKVGLDPVLPIFRELKKQGMVQPGKVDARAAIKKYIHPDRRAKVFPLLEQRLAA